MTFLQSESSWLFISFLVFCGILWKYAVPILLGLLDKRIAQVKEDLRVAENLKTEAQELLAQYERKQRDSEKEAEKLIAQAEKQAEDIRKMAEKNLDESIARREKQLQDRLTRMQDDAKEELRQYAAKLALEATTQIITEKLTKSANENLIQRSLSGLEQALRS